MGTVQAPIDDWPPARLRRLAAALVAGDPAGTDGPWLGGALQEYLDGAAAGATLDEAFGLAPAIGGPRWWTVEAIQRRDEILRTIARRHFAGQSLDAQGREIEAAAARYAAAGLHHDRKRRRVAAVDVGTLRELLFAWRETGQAFPLKHRQIVKILGRG